MDIRGLCQYDLLHHWMQYSLELDTFLISGCTPENTSELTLVAGGASQPVLEGKSLGELAHHLSSMRWIG